MTAFIWDLDGTLLDSYEAILAAINQALRNTDVPFDKEAIRRHILATSVKDFFEKIEKETGNNLKSLYQTALPQFSGEIRLLPGAQEVLDWAEEQGIQQFVFTHKDEEAHPLLERLDLAAYFREVVTASDGFARKPDPEALYYLMDKYKLNPDQTYYIGDRLLDIEAALAAGIQSINFLSHPESQAIEHLGEISELPFL